jgi:hypothetical protein
MSSSSSGGGRQRKSLNIDDFYMSNPFRVLKLSADATTRDIDRAGQKLQMQIRLGQSDSDGSESKAPDVLIGDVKRAVQQLKNPVERIQHEMFWITLSPDEIEIWDKYEELREFPEGVKRVAGVRYNARIKNVPVITKSCNLAVLYHGQAIALERRRLQNRWTSKANEVHDELWKKAFRYWSWVLASDEFWNRIKHRVNDFNDPRLPASKVEEIRRSLAGTILKPSVEIANEYLLALDEENTKRHIKYLESSDLGPAHVTSALKQFYGPLVKRIHESIERNDDQIKDLDQRAVNRNDRVGTLLPSDDNLIHDALVSLRNSFYTEISPSIRIIQTVGDLPGSSEENALDGAAKLLRSIAQSLSHYFDDYVETAKTLGIALEWVSSPSLKIVLEKDFKSYEKSPWEEEW